MKEGKSKRALPDEDALANLSKKSDEEIQQILNELYKKEERLSYQRRILHGKIDILRAELVERLKKRCKAGKSVISGSDIQRLAEILARGFKHTKDVY
ncbi:MAG: hypothetical protein AB1466_02110 [Actinomycetota bacterium]